MTKKHIKMLKVGIITTLLLVSYSLSASEKIKIKPITVNPSTSYESSSNYNDFKDSAKKVSNDINKSVKKPAKKGMIYYKKKSINVRMQF